MKFSIQRLFVKKRGIRPKKLDFGLFHGASQTMGHQVSHSERKTIRKFKPNIQWGQLYSEILGHKIDVKVTPRALRCIDKIGGLDRYLLLTKTQLLDSKTAFFWRRRLLEVQWQKKQDTEYEAKVLEKAKLLAVFISEKAPELKDWKPTEAAPEENAFRKKLRNIAFSKRKQKKDMIFTRGAQNTKIFKQHQYKGGKSYTANVNVPANGPDVPAIHRVDRIINDRGVLFRG